MAEETSRRAVEFAKCAADVAYFTNTYLVIDDAQGHGDGGGTMPFTLWPAQVGVLWKFMQHRRVLILKARQLGISWLCCAYALWHCLFSPGKVVMLFSKGKSEANELLRRIRVLYERLPDWMLEALPTLEISNTTELGWSNGSRVKSNPATQSAGRSFTASLVILDEAAFLQWAQTLYTSMKPVIDGGGQLIILSTANGVGNLFHQLWTKAAAKLNDFCAVFLPWWSRPERTAAWFAKVQAEETDPAKIPQEYPATANEAFVSSGRVRFPGKWIAAQAKNVWDVDKPAEKQHPNARRALPAEQLPEALRDLPGLQVYSLPIPGRRYVLGADVAEGLEHGDYCAAVLLDAVTLEEVALLHGKWEPGEYAGHLWALGAAYRAELAVERNNHGHAVLLALSMAGYPWLICSADERLGWLTTKVTKPMVIDGLAGVLKDALLTLHSQPALDELQVYQVLKDGKTGALEGFYDDIVMALAIAVQVAKFPPLPADDDEIMSSPGVQISPY